METVSRVSERECGKLIGVIPVRIGRNDFVQDVSIYCTVKVKVEQHDFNDKGVKDSVEVEESHECEFRTGAVVIKRA